jgi:hypothetical protein
MTESALLLSLIDAVLEANVVDVDAGALQSTKDDEGDGRERISVRLRHGDHRRLERRAALRQLRPATYVACLVHAHITGDAPLPLAELDSLKTCVARLSETNRALQAVADRAADRLAADGMSLLHATGALVEDVRRASAELVRSNLMSWETHDA